ncbi:MAG: hypothetical protein F9K27_05945 [Anaerolineae bacterium]|nr:MAG: hypothetical protein F9K27_05945 [Anaerolineae bacterium]
MHPLKTFNESYWTEEFVVTDDDLEFLNNLFLEEETPLRTPELIQHLINRHIDNEVRMIKKYSAQGTIYRPAQSFKVGQELVFPVFGFEKGTVVSERPGINPDYSAFKVLEVEFDGGRRRELASELKVDHKLNVDTLADIEKLRPDVKKIYNRYKRVLTPIVVDALKQNEDMLFIAKRWFLKSLLLEVDQGFLNLSEAILDMNNGGPLPTKQIADEIGFGQNANPILQTVSLDYGLSKDDRFDEVGPAGQVLWFLRSMEPKEILEPPAVLRYNPIVFDQRFIQGEMLQWQKSIDDEFTDLELFEDEDDELEDEVTITLNYPHWRMGTLPLTWKVEHLFPTAHRAPRIKIILVDAQHDNAEIDGWVVREYGFVYGLGNFYQEHKLPVGAQITVRHEEEGGRLFIDFEAHKPRSEWVKVAHVENNRLRFEERQQLIGALYDQLMVLGVQDIASIDAAADHHRKHNFDLTTIMTDLIRELSVFSPQGHVHCVTLYSAVNMIRRCPPGPIFARLETHPNFVHAGGPYWRLA